MKNTKSLKIGFVFDDSLDSSDGVAQYVKTLGLWLSSQGHEVRYLVGETKMSSWGGGRVYSLAKNFKVRFNGNNLTIPGPANKARIKEVLASENFDVLHVQVPYSPFLAARIIKLAPPSTAVIGTFHIYPSGFLSRFGSRLLKIWLRRSLRMFSSVVSVSTAAQEFAASAYGIKSHIVPNLVDLKAFKNNAKNHQNTIVFLGRLVERKGCLELIKAFAALKQNIPSARLIIGGKGPQADKLQKYVVANKIADVEFKGFIAEEEKPAFFAQGAIACLPSLYGECFGIVLIEAMAAGAGVVLGGDNPGYRSVLGEQEELLINPRNTAEFSRRLEKLLTDQQAAKNLHDWGSKAVKQYDVNVVGAQVLEVYSSSIALKNKNEHNNF